MEATKISETQRILSEIRLDRRRDELEEARKTALRTSGARGKKARLDEIKAEESLKEAEEACVCLYNHSRYGLTKFPG